MHTVTFPWPPSCLSPNAKRRSHWSKYSGPTKKYRALCGWLAKEQGLHLTRRNDPDTKFHVGLTFNQPTKHRRDMDGMLGSFKAGLDGLADAMGVDDHKFELSLKTGEIIKGGSVVARIEAIL